MIFAGFSGEEINRKKQRFTHQFYDPKPKKEKTLKTFSIFNILQLFVLCFCA